MRRVAAFTLILVLLGLGLVTFPAVAEGESANDDWPDSDCASAPLISDGTYSGTLTPGDYDLMRVDVPTASSSRLK